MLSTKDIVLFLLSSVFVSSESAQKKSEGEHSSEGRETDEIGEAAVMICNANGGTPPPQFTKQLDSKWTFWFETKTRRDRNRNLSKTDYLKDFKKSKTFDTIKSFWDCWKEVQKECNPSASDCNYELFKHGIKPVWEDPKNIKGGRCVLSYPRTTQEETMRQWVSLMITLLIGEFGPEINGVVLSTRTWGNTYSVWVRNSKDREAVDTAMRKLHEIFGANAQIKFQRHQAAIRKKFENGAKPQFGRTMNFSNTLEKKRLSDSEGSSSEGEQREKNKGKERPRRRSVVNEDTKGMLHDLIQEVTDAPVRPPFEKVGTEEAAHAPKSLPEESSIERVPIIQKRSSSISTPNKPTVKKPLPHLHDLSTRDVAVGVGVITLGIAASVLSWAYL
jgi:translation initiation factor 4E